MADFHAPTPEAATGTEINDKPTMARTRTLRRVDIGLRFKETHPTYKCVHELGYVQFRLIS